VMALLTSLRLLLLFSSCFFTPLLGAARAPRALAGVVRRRRRACIRGRERMTAKIAD
jgi:hypothetical protein